MFSRLKDYLFVAICDQENCEASLDILSKLFSTDLFKFNLFQEAKDIFSRTLHLLYETGTDGCKDAFKKFIENAISGEDSAFKNFIRDCVKVFKDENPNEFEQSGLREMVNGI